MFFNVFHHNFPLHIFHQLSEIMLRLCLGGAVAWGSLMWAGSVVADLAASCDIMGDFILAVGAQSYTLRCD